MNKIIDLLLDYAMLGIEDHCPDLDQRELLLGYIDNLYELSEYMQDAEKEFNGLFAETIQDCFIVETEDEYFNFNE